MAKWIDGEKLMEYWQEWDWWDKKGMPHCFGYIPDKIVEREMERAPELKQVIHAHWTYEIDDLFPADSMMICSNCGEYERLGANDNYCGNCGAKMDEEVDDG